MSLTVSGKDLRQLQICLAARVVEFKQACRLRAKNPQKMSLNTLSSLRSLIDEAEEQIAEFQEEHLL